MSKAYSTHWCSYCRRETQHERQDVNHILHLVLTIITGGLWLLVWILLWMLSKFNAKYCCHCHTQN